MTEDLEAQLRSALGNDAVEIPADADQALRAGRRIVRGRRIGWGLGACAVVAAAALVLPGVLQRPVAAVPAQPVGTVSASPAPADGWLIGTEWSVVKLGGAAILPGSSMTLAFGDGVVTGFGGCNGFGNGMTGTTADTGWYRQDGDRLAIGRVLSTYKGCPADGTGEQETRYFTALTSVQRFAVAGGSLRLLGADDIVLLELERVPVKLEGTGWQVTAIDGAPIVRGARQPGLLFHNGSIVADNGCNGITGTFSQTGDLVSFGKLLHTLAHCQDQARRQQEGAFDEAFGKIRRAIVDGGHLHLLDQAGGVQLEAIPDAARILGADGHTWRLEGKDGPTQITLKVDSGRLTGRTGCGDYAADVTRTGDAWTVTKVQRSNMHRCANTASAASERFLGLLEEVTRVEASEKQLQLRTPEEILFFSRG